MSRLLGLTSFKRVVPHRWKTSGSGSGSGSGEEAKGVQFVLNEDEARLSFDRWLKSLWFAPGGWREKTRDEQITVLPRYLPFWNYSLHGSVNASLRVHSSQLHQRGDRFVRSGESDSIPMSLSDLSLVDVNICASQTYDRYHLNQLEISFEDKKIVSLSTEEKILLDQWTVDRQTAFQIGWDLNVIPLIQRQLIEQTTKLFPGSSPSHVERFHWKIRKKEERLLSYPIYVIEYEYGEKSRFTCLIDGLNGRVRGDRQYSFVKVTLASLVGFYPLALFSLVSVGSMIDPSLGLFLASLLSFSHSIPLALILSPLIGLWAKNSPRLYRQRINQQQWNNYQSNSTQFTYDFTSNFQQQYRSYQQQQQSDTRQEQRSWGEAKRKSEEESWRDLYLLLGVDRQATEKEIKRAYFIKAKELHPDRNPNNRQAEEQFKRVNQAYAILSDQFKRKQYDRYGYDAVKYN